jgi:hypothetical protein
LSLAPARLLLLTLLAAVPSLAAEPSAVVSGLPLSLGPGYRVTAPLTFDRAKAAQGGFIFAAPRATPADDAAIRLSQAVLTGGGGALGPAGVLARRHGVPALSLPRARWESGALVVSLPVFGAAIGGVRPVERMESRRVQEGEAVAVEPEDGLLVLLDPGSQAFELDLAQALRGFDGLRDMQGLLQWYDARVQDGPSPALAARLVEELAARLAAGTATEAEFSRLRRAVDSGLDAAGRALTADAAARAAERRLRGLGDRLDDLAAEATDAGSASAAQRLAAEGRRASSAAKSLAASVSRPALARPVEQAAQKLAAAARKREGELGRKALTPADALAAAGAARAAGVELPASLYERFIADAGLASSLEETADDASLDLGRKGERLGQLIAAARLSADSGAGRDAAARLPKGALLDICGPEGCKSRVPAPQALAAVKEVWARSWSADALGRRKRAGAAFSPPALRVSEFLPAEASGVAWSRDPVGGSLRRVVVEAVFGEPDAVESGSATGDEYALDRRTLEPALPAVVADKRERLDSDARSGALSKGAVAPGLALSRALTPAQAAQAARAARALDDALGQGARLTFAFSGGKLYVRSWLAASAAPRP